MSRLPLVASRRLCAVMALGIVGSQLTACVMFREPIVTAPAPQPEQTAPRSSMGTPGPNPVVPSNAAPAPTLTPPPPVTAPPVATRQFQLGAATASLVAQAHRQAVADPQLAISTIERALRIEPDNPLLWIELGEAHEAAGRFEQAAGMGHKALQLATGDPHAQSASWHLIADSLKARGRNGEAAEAQRRADELRSQ